MRGHLHLKLIDRTGAEVASRRASNTVMRSGAKIVAELFAGQGQPVTHMSVGVSDADPDDTEREASVRTRVGCIGLQI